MQDEKIITAIKVESMMNKVLNLYPSCSVCDAYDDVVSNHAETCKIRFIEIASRIACRVIKPTE